MESGSDNQGRKTATKKVARPYERPRGGDAGLGLGLTPLDLL